MNRKVIQSRYCISFNDAKKIGLLIHNPDPTFNGPLTSFVKDLKKEGKAVECLCFISKKNIIHYDFPCFYFSYEHIDWKGDFKEERINKFIKTDFDYLYSINNSPTLPLKIILQKSMAKCRIGHYEPGTSLDFMIDPGNDNSLKTLLEQMIIYSKKIKTNE